MLESKAGLAPHAFPIWPAGLAWILGEGGSLHLHYLTAQVTAFPVGFSSSLQNEGLHAAGQHVFILYVCVQAAWPPSGQFGSGRLGDP